MGEHRTRPMIRFPGLTNGATVVNENVGEPPPSVLGQKCLEIHLDLVGIGVFRKAQTNGKPFDMGIHHDPRYIKGGAQDTVGGLSAHPRQLDQFLHGGGNFSAVSVHQSLTASLDGFGLVSEKPGGPNVHFQLTDGDGQKILRGSIFLKENFGDRIYLLIRTLGREDGADQQLEWGFILEGGLLQRIEWIQNFENLFYPGGSALFTFHNLLTFKGVPGAALTIPL